MATDLIVAGPFELKCKKQATGSAKQVTSENVKEFLASNEFAAVSQKQGCYIFGLRASRGFMVWYVGKATKSMKQECLTCLLYTSPSPRDKRQSRMPSSA